VILEFIDDLNWAAVGGSLLIVFVIGSIWFTPAVLGNYWARQVSRYSGASQAEITSGASRPGALLRWIAGMSINVIVLALAVVAAGGDSAVEGIVLGAILWLGFGATFSSWPPIFARMPWEWWLVNNGAFLAMQITAGAILAVWR
jgi:hypothetical protein